MTHNTAKAPAVKSDSHDPITLERLAEVLEGVTWKTGRAGFKALCPAHADRLPSLNVDDKAGKPVWHCHAGCDQDRLTAALVSLCRGEHLPQPNGNGTEPRRVFAVKPLGKPEAVYSYQNANGEEIFQNVRFEGKLFRQRRPSHSEPPADPWIYNTQGIVPVLYRLPEVLAAAKSGLEVWITEGEKDADRLASLGLAATTAPRGAAAPWLDSYTQALQGAGTVYVLPDNDAPGKSHAEKVAQALAKANVPVRVVELPDLPEHGDVSDWIDQGGTVDQLRELADGAPVYLAEYTRPLTDAGNAERLIDRHGSNLRYVEGTGWYVYDGRRWVCHGREALTVQALAIATIREMYGVAERENDTEKRRKLAKHAEACEAANRIEKMVRLAAADARTWARPEDFDRDPLQLNVENGTVDLRTGLLRPHRATDMLSKMCPVRYDPGQEFLAWAPGKPRAEVVDGLRVVSKARAPRWYQFVAEIMREGEESDTPEGRPLCNYLRQAVGVSITGLVKEHALFLLHGGGRNGKSTFTEICKAMMGDYAVSPVHDFLLNHKYADAASARSASAMNKLRGSRIVCMVETGENKALDEAKVKLLTGGDRLQGGRFHAEPTEFDPTHKVWMATNHLPRIRGTDEAIWRRVRRIPFDATFTEDVADPNLLDKLRSELDGVLLWAISGALEYVASDYHLPTPEAVENATAEYRVAEDYLGQFFEECVAEDGDSSATHGQVAKAYEAWCQERQERPRSSRELFGRIRKMPGVREGGRGNRTFYGIRLLNPITE